MSDLSKNLTEKKARENHGPVFEFVGSANGNTPADQAC